MFKCLEPLALGNGPTKGWSKVGGLFKGRLGSGDRPSCKI